MRRWILALLLLVPVMTGCAGEQPAGIDAPRSLSVSSPTIQPDQPIPQQHTCDGANRSPALTVGELPAKAQTVALVLDDPDAPGQTFVHWVVWNLDVQASTTQVPEGSVPQGASEGENSADRTGYTGPCPPAGDDAHRYRFRAYAVDARLQLDQGASHEALLDAIGPHTVAWGELSATYDR